MKKVKTNPIIIEGQPLYRYWQALYLSFYSRNLYVDVGKRWKGIGFLYFLFLIVVISIPLSVKNSLIFYRYFKVEMVEPMKAMPELYFQDGKMTIKGAVPYLVRNDSGAVKIVIDTADGDNALVKKYVNQYPEMTVLFAGNAIYLRKESSVFKQMIPQSQGRSETVDFIEFQSDSESNGAFNGQDLVSIAHLDALKYSILLFTPLAIIFFWFVFLGILILVFSLLAQLLARLFFDFKLGIKQTIRMMTVSVTPAIACMFAILTFGLQITYAALFLFIIFALYYCYGVLALKHESQRIVRQ